MALIICQCLANPACRQGIIITAKFAVDQSIQLCLTNPTCRGALNDMGYEVAELIDGFMNESAEGKEKPKLEVDEVGKVHGELPGVEDLADKDLDDNIDELEDSIRERKDEQIRLGEEGKHRERIRQEEDLVRQLKKRREHRDGSKNVDP